MTDWILTSLYTSQQLGRAEILRLLRNCISRERPERITILIANALMPRFAPAHKVSQTIQSLCNDKMRISPSLSFSVFLSQSLFQNLCLASFSLSLFPSLSPISISKSLLILSLSLSLCIFILKSILSLSLSPERSRALFL